MSGLLEPRSGNDNATTDDEDYFGTTDSDSEDTDGEVEKMVSDGEVEWLNNQKSTGNDEAIENLKSGYIKLKNDSEFFSRTRNGFATLLTKTKNCEACDENDCECDKCDPDYNPGDDTLLMERPLMDIPSEIQLQKWKVPELKSKLTELGLPLSGNKSNLVERLTLFYRQQEQQGAGKADTGETNDGKETPAEKIQKIMSRLAAIRKETDQIWKETESKLQKKNKEREELESEVVLLSRHLDLKAGHAESESSDDDWLYEKSKSVSYYSYYDSDESSSSTLLKACAKENVKAVEKLLSEGADVNKETDGNFPLHIAMKVNNARIVKLLLARPETRLDITDWKGQTPLHLACIDQASDGLAYLKSAIPLFCKDARCTPDILNSKNRDGKTALMEAVESGSLVPVVMLSKVKAVNWKIKNIGGEWGESLLEVAEEMAYNGENDNLEDRQQIRAIVEVKLGGKKSGISEDYYEDY